MGSEPSYRRFQPHETPPRKFRTSGTRPNPEGGGIIPPLAKDFNGRGLPGSTRRERPLQLGNLLRNVRFVVAAARHGPRRVAGSNELKSGGDAPGNTAAGSHRIRGLPTWSRLCWS